ncbi:MAG: STAS/SEC14 domain-containing protein [Porticoccaceae bacterium]|nr:STAS/SEC14 domain-containing protein [Porticoccaceae bacterium]
MISCSLFEDIGVCLLELAEHISEGDMQEARDQINEYLGSHPDLSGLVVHAEFFPWWSEFAALVGQLSFAGNHHQTLVRVAICSDVDVEDLLPAIGKHFFAAEVKSFKGDQVSEALHWAQGE